MSIVFFVSLLGLNLWRRISAYHLAQELRDVEVTETESLQRHRVLVTTSTRDDRVHPSLNRIIEWTWIRFLRGLSFVKNLLSFEIQYESIKLILKCLYDSVIGTWQYVCSQPEIWGAMLARWWKSCKTCQLVLPAFKHTSMSLDLDLA